MILLMFDIFAGKMEVYRSVLILFVLVSVLVRAMSSTEKDILFAGLIRRVTTGDHRTGPKVQTKDGIIRGLTADKAHIFYGIPFAAPPVGANRWKPPRPVSPWRGERDATFPRAACMQPCIRASSEECPKMVSK